MKTFVRIGSLVIAAALGTLLAGCSSYSSSARGGQPLRDFEVVETSTKRQLTDQDMAYLRAKVAEYLAEKGEMGSGDFYLKVYLGEEPGVEQGDWVVVRYTRYPSASYSVASIHPLYSYPAYGYSTFDYFPFGWMGYGAFSLRYYDDPYWYYGYAGGYPYYAGSPLIGGRWHDRDRWHDHRGDRDHDHDGNGDRPGAEGRPSGALKPSFRPAHVNQPPSSSPPPFVVRHGNSTAEFPRRDDAGDNRRPHRGRSGSPEFAGGSAPSSTGTGGSEAPRPATRSVLHRDRAAAEAVRPLRTEAAADSGYHAQRNRDYAPAPRSEQSSGESRSQDSYRQEQTPNYSQPETRSEPSYQPATRSELHSGRR